MSKISVDPGELRAAAHAEDSISEDMKEKNNKAISTAKDAGASLKGWSLSQALLTLANTWEPALDGMRRRATAGAANLRTCADGHEWNDATVSKDFEATDARAESAPQTMTAFGGPGGVGSEGRHATPGAESLRAGLQPDSAIGGPGAVGSEGRSAMPGAASLRDGLSDPLDPGTPGTVGSEGTSPVTNPAFTGREDAPYTGPDPRAEWTIDEMQNARPTQEPAGDSPFG
ncbi:hypothetical protein ACGH2B_08700 [Streptomyces sp. BBFR2]|uniref:hypothetical protein n=1 Tax=Streptomyces sp. BBFR2 TaxID=3372854 RepID=UPI0037DA6158